MELMQRIYNMRMTFRLHVLPEDDRNIPEQVKWSVIIDEGYDHDDTYHDERVIIGEHTPILGPSHSSTGRRRRIGTSDQGSYMWSFLYWIGLPANLSDGLNGIWDTATEEDDELWLRETFGDKIRRLYVDYNGTGPIDPANMTPLGILYTCDNLEDATA